MKKLVIEMTENIFEFFSRGQGEGGGVLGATGTGIIHNLHLVI